MRVIAPLVVIVLFTTVMVGCGDGRGGADAGAGSVAARVEPDQRDSAGVMILQFAANAPDQVPQVTVDTTDPLAVIGAREDGSDDLTLVHDFAMLPGGSVVLWDNRSSIVQFGPDGRLLHRIGRLGQGPGDFGTVWGIALSGDSIAISDPANSRVAVYSSALELIGYQPIPAECRGLHLVGRLAGSGFVGFPGDLLPWGLQLSDSIQRAPVAVTAVGPAGCDTLVVLPGLQVRTVEFTQLGRTHVHSVPVFHGLHSVAAVWDSVLVVGTGDEYALDLLDHAGRLRRSLRLGWPGVKAPEGLRERVIEKRLEGMSTPAAERMIDAEASRRDARENTYVAEWLPPYSDVMVSHDGLLWVAEGYAPGMETRSALAFDRSGNLVKRLRLPGRYQLEGFGADRVLTRTEDPETGVVTLQVLRLVPHTPWL